MEEFPSAIVEQQLNSGAVKDIGAFGIDLVNGTTLLDYNSSKIFKAASTIKIPIACALEAQIESGSVEYGTAVQLHRSDLVGGSGLLRLMEGCVRPTIGCMEELMLTVSDNTATNILIDVIGKSSVNKLLSSYGFTDIRLAGKLMRPRKKRFNSASASDMAGLMSKLYNGEVVSRRASKRILHILEFQQHHSLIPAALPNWGIRFANKPGSLEDLRADVALVWTKEFAFAVAIYVSGFNDFYRAESAVREIARAVFLSASLPVRR